ncbi:MAG: hypothetical protein GX034_03820 [Clostridiaceae bacterium]|jgi:hypothetical protein|nr:hypothetical protein [Clostridiaceae bacterium]
MYQTTSPKFSQTKIKLTDALLCLINEEDREFDEITVRDISRVSGLSRTTFYNHFLDIYDLAFFVFELESIDAVNLMFEEDNFIKSFTESMKFMRKNKKFYEKVVKLGGPNSFVSNYYKKVMKHTKEYYRNQYLTEEVEFALEIYWIGATLRLEKWIKDDMKESPEKMGENFYKSMPEILRLGYR